MTRCFAVTALALTFLLGAVPASAVSLANGALAVNGYGNWRFAKSDGNVFLGDEDGDWETAEVALSFVARPTENVMVQVQPFWELGDEGVEAEMDMTYVDYAFADALHVRFGKGRHPFGIYTPIYDVGTLRPFMTLPTGLYADGAGLIAESYTGVGASGSVGAGGWRVGYDLYGGTLELEASRPWEAAEEAEGAEEAGGAEEAEEGLELELEDLVGGQVIVHAPIDGLSFGASAYTATVTGEAEDGALEDNRDTCWGLQAEYLTDVFSVRAEYVKQSVDDVLDAEGAYAEAAYMLTKQVQLAARWDRHRTSVEGEDVDEALTDHDELAFGVNWWFSPSFVVKLSYHVVDGLRFASPEEAEAGEEEAVDEKTNTVVFGASYSF